MATREWLFGVEEEVVWIARLRGKLRGTGLVHKGTLGIKPQETYNTL